MAGEHRFERVGNLADRGARPRRLDRQCQQIAVAAPRRFGQRRQRLSAALGVAAAPNLVEPRDLRRAHRGVVDIEQVDLGRLARLVFVDADDRLLAAVDRRLAARRGFLDAQFRHAGLDRLGHAAHRLDLVDQRRRRLGQRMGQAFEVIAAAERIDDMGDAGFLGEDQLGVAGDAHRGRGRQGHGLVERIGVQGLGAAQHRRHRLDRGADDVVVRVLLGQADARGLAMRAQRQARRVLRRKLPHQPRPQQRARRAVSRSP